MRLIPIFGLSLLSCCVSSHLSFSKTLNYSACVGKIEYIIDQGTAKLSVTITEKDGEFKNIINLQAGYGVKEIIFDATPLQNERWGFTILTPEYPIHPLFNQARHPNQYQVIIDFDEAASPQSLRTFSLTPNDRDGCPS